jgi:hypothetical protein
MFSKIIYERRVLCILKIKHSKNSHYVMWEKPRNSAQKQILFYQAQVHFGIQGVLLMDTKKHHQNPREPSLRKT